VKQSPTLRPRGSPLSRGVLHTRTHAFTIGLGGLSSGDDVGKAWNAKAEFVHLSGELAETTGIAFQRLVLPLVRILWPKAVMTQPRARLDRLGIDIIAPAEPPYEVVIQCKGLEVSQDAIGPAHIRQFHDSLAAFARGSINADVYLFVHNREHRDPDLWEPLAGELR